jgi:hypothetical protein
MITTAVADTLFTMPLNVAGLVALIVRDVLASLNAPPSGKLTFQSYVNGVVPLAVPVSCSDEVAPALVHTEVNPNPVGEPGAAGNPIADQ